MKTIYFFSFLLSLGVLHAQYTSPGTGEVFTLSDLTLTEPAAVVLSGVNEYTLNAALTISVNDTLLIDEPLTLKITGDTDVSIFGTFLTYTESEDEAILITAEEILAPYAPIRLEEGSFIDLNNTILEYGSGIRTFTANFSMNDCTVRYMGDYASVSAALSFSRGNPVISNSHFYMNDLAAIGSGANQMVGAKILNNTFEFNSQLNENRPQINLSASGSQDTLVIANNLIVGDREIEMAGGIAVANFFSSPNNVVIRDNEIRDNRFGITLMGPNQYALIANNIITDNNTQNDPMLGGSGINLIGSGDVVNTNTFISGNEISGNLWGITLQGNAVANMGDGTEQSPGGNTFSDNGNNGFIYALYNNTSNTLSAQNNCWIAGQESSAEEVEEVIFHQNDDSSLGFVNYTGFNCNLGINEVVLTENVQLYPNPARNFIILKTEFSGLVEFYSVSGKMILKSEINSGENRISFNLPNGVYFIKIKSSDKEIYKKMLIR